MGRPDADCGDVRVECGQFGVCGARDDEDHEGEETPGYVGLK